MQCNLQAWATERALLVWTCLFTRACGCGCGCGSRRPAWKETGSIQLSLSCMPVWRDAIEKGADGFGDARARLPRPGGVCARVWRRLCRGRSQFANRFYFFGNVCTTATVTVVAFNLTLLAYILVVFFWESMYPCIRYVLYRISVPILV
jgi:hypothetical protein